MASTAIVIMGLSSGNSGQPETAGHTSGHALFKAWHKNSNRYLTS